MKLKSNSYFALIAVFIITIGSYCDLVMQPVQAATSDKTKVYYLDYEFNFLHDNKTARVSINLSKNDGLLKSLQIFTHPEHHTEFEGDGKIKIEADYLIWYPPKEGGKLSYLVKIDRKRESGAYGAYFAKDWAIFRGDHLVPAVKTVTKRNAVSCARLQFNVPDGWAAVTPYEALDEFTYAFDDPQRRFDRPTGWMIIGDIGTREEQILNTRMIIAGPKNQGVRRQDTLGFLNWNLPEIVAVFPNFYQSFLIISAADPMWRGGLSGPGSLYVHKDRPLISENGTSTLIHELIHTAMRINGGSRDDWIVEGFAEFYSLEIMRRSGTITNSRYQQSMLKLAQWSSDVTALRIKRSYGPITARAVLLMKELDDEIRHVTDNKASLDDVAREFARVRGQVNLAQLRRIIKTITGSPSKTLSKDNALLAD